MSSLNKCQLISAFKQLGEYLTSADDALRLAVSQANNVNAWFTEAEVNRAIAAIAEMLNEQDVDKWFENIQFAVNPKQVGLILAGNIPLVGFHDVLSVLASGNIALIKLSSSDSKLLPFVLQQLCTYEPQLTKRIVYVERLKDFDAVIATGSNNTSRYFDYYFGKVPNIIRKNRNSVAIITGKETAEEIELLGHDIFDYFGMGCRSVSKIYIPNQYDVAKFFAPLEKFTEIINHFKYNNNYDYNKSIYLVNQQNHFDNGFLLVKQDQGLASPLAVLYYETYGNLNEVAEKLNDRREEIQCITAQTEIPGLTSLPFGQSQHPKLWDYADNVNTIDFLNSISSANA
jgi:hypothetical protein